MRSGGWLGSHIDEERSELWNVMRIAELVNHRIFERKLRPVIICSQGIPVSVSTYGFIKRKTIWHTTKKQIRPLFGLFWMHRSSILIRTTRLVEEVILFSQHFPLIPRPWWAWYPPFRLRASKLRHLRGKRETFDRTLGIFQSGDER